MTRATNESKRKEVLEDYVDSEAYKNHELFSVRKNGLQIFFYYDDLEVCNSLGSKTKTHKLSK